MFVKSIYQELSDERKELQDKGLVPEWFATSGWQLLKAKYLTEKETNLKDIHLRISKYAAKYTKNPEYWQPKFFNILWNGWLAASTPVLANMGAFRGCPVSCSGNAVGDNIYSFYDSQTENAMLSKNGFGISSYLGGIRPRGSTISNGGLATGILPVLKDFVQLSRDITQGAQRRGAWAGYIEIDHDDFWEIITFLQNNPDDCNIGWNISNNFIERLNNGDEDAISRYQLALKVKMLTGKGYFLFVDKINEMNPPCYKDQNMKVKASNLCTEISLFSDEDHTFSCVLSSMNLYKYDEWKNTDAVFTATVFLDCVAQDFIKLGSEIRGLEKTVRSTEKGRALGLGALGFHSYLQKNMIPFDSIEAHMKNIEIFKYLNNESLKASKWMAEEYGEPEWCKGYGLRNTHRLAVAPNTSSALICGGLSQGIEPVYKNIFVQGSAGGEINRINPILLKLMKEKNVYNDKNIKSIKDNQGSVQNVDWLTDDEKAVFKTAFEIDQKTIIRLAATRQKYIDQGQSLNLFFAADEDEEYISEVHQEAFSNPMIKALYYIRSESGVQAAKGECLACEG